LRFYLVMHGDFQNPYNMIKLLIPSKYLTPVLLVFVLLFSSNIFGKNNQPSIFDLMHHQDVLRVTLEADFSFLKANRYDEGSHKAHLAFKDENGKKQDWDLEVNLRGAYRRVHCSVMPPLKLNFKKKELRAAGLADFNDLKLVPYCMGSEEDARDALLREYLTYKLFNAVSEQSFRVQLLQITYLDAGTREKTLQWAFLIEDTAQLRDRIGADKAEEMNFYGLTAERFEQDYLRTVAVFQYMIGNADWSIGTSKNLKFLLKEGRIIAVPYDFDFTGLVAAPYFVPDANYALTSRDERVYLGFPDDLPCLEPTILHFVDKRPLLESIIKNFKPLSRASRKDMLDYLGGFFDNTEILKTGERIIAGSSR